MNALSRPLNPDSFLKSYQKAYFLIFLMTNGLLSYGNLTLQTDLWVGFIGLLVPCVFFVSMAFDKNRSAASSRDPEPTLSLPAWLVAAMVPTALLICALNVAWLKPWPTVDDSLSAYYSVELSQQWKLKFFFATAQHPPLFNWILSVFFRLFEPSFYSTGLFLFLVGAAMVCAAYAFSRRLFFNGVSLFCFFGLAAGFWSLYTGQFSVNWGLFLLFQTLVLGLFFLLARKPAVTRRSELTLALGLVTGLGFYVDIAWPCVAAMVTLGLCFLLGKSDWKKFLLFLIPMMVLSLPFYIVGIREGYGEHIQSLLWLNNPSGLKVLWANLVNYGTALFWTHYGASYGASWGGLLNPIYSAFFLVGILECVRKKLTIFGIWILIAFGLSLAPGLLSIRMDLFRILQILPVILLVSGIGFQAFISSFPKKIQAGLILFLFSFSFGLDMNHLLISKSNRMAESPQSSSAYKILGQIRDQMGPGAVLLDLRPDFWDRSLQLATYPFNAASNPRLSWPDVKWIGILESSDYQPYLKVRYPEAAWYDLGPHPQWNRTRLVLGIIPVNPQNRPVLRHWFDADLIFQKIALSAFDSEPFISLDQIVGRLQEAEPGLGGDPFLVSCYCEKLFLSMPSEEQKSSSGMIRKSLKGAYPLPFFNSWREAYPE